MPKNAAETEKKMSGYFHSFFHVRQANYSDIPAIMSITREAFQKYDQMSESEYLDALHETEKDIKHDIDTKIVLIAIRDDVPVGSVRVEVDRENKTAYLSRFAVKVNSQNNGIGKSIMNLVDEMMMKENIKSISLHTDSKITSLVRFYYGRGFYIDSIDRSRGYLRAHLTKDYIY